MQMIPSHGSTVRWVETIDTLNMINPAHAMAEFEAEWCHCARVKIDWKKPHKFVIQEGLLRGINILNQFALS